MFSRVLEICEENRYLSLDRGFLVVKHGDEILGKVPLDDIGVLLVSAQSASFSKKILNALSERGCITILCGDNYAPQSLIIPQSIHYQQSRIIKAQINCSVPIKKRIWQQIVVSKIQNQALTLEHCNKNDDAKLLQNISCTVSSGDKENREAYAARMYWKALFGEDFIRDQKQDGINSLLNYGYAIVRSAVARAVVSAGLLPALGIHHDNNLNELCLVDDLMEIYRPIIDLLVYKIAEKGGMELTSENKKALAKCLLIRVHSEEGDTPVFQSMHYFAGSYVKALDLKKPVINLPDWKGNKDGITIIE